MASSTNGMKNKNKQVTRGGWTTAFGYLLVFFTAPFVLFRAWEGFCRIPTELPLSEDFIQVVSPRGRSEVELLQRLYYGMSGSLMRHGSVESIWPFEFRYHCRPGSCDLTYAHVWVGVGDYPICTFERRLKATIVETYIRNIDRGDPYVEFDHWRVGGSRTPIPKPDWHEISSDIAAIKEYVLNSIGNDAWDTHSLLSVKLHSRRTGWSVNVSSTFSGELIYRADLDRSEYQNEH